MKAINISLKQVENKNLRNSALITTGVISILLLLSFFWSAKLPQVPPMEEIIILLPSEGDFGDLREGSLNVNNRLPAVANPSPSPSQSQARTTPVETSTPPVTTPEPSPITSPPTENAQATEPIPPQPRPVEAHDPFANDPGETETGSGTPGSNDGSGNGVGNSGNPNAVTFGNGVGYGSGMRKPLAMPMPSYTSNQEAPLTFRIVIAPDGHVKQVIKPITQHTALANAGAQAIYKWKFEPINGTLGDQTTKVTITFRMR